MDNPTPYAAFIMTYKRPDILKETIGKLRSQMCPPSTILIVDNCPDYSAKEIAGISNCHYFGVGYNSGPAGAAHHGLKNLFEQGWEWVLWLDDDDPPVLPDITESLLSLTQKHIHENIGMVGAVGTRFDSGKARSVRLANHELSGSIEVDFIAGGQFPLVNKKVYDAGILPNRDLFFGFEELEFCLRVKKAGLKILADGELMLKLRTHFKRLDIASIPAYVKKNSLWREYYSTRSMIHILKNVSNNRQGLRLYISKIIAKSMFGFRYGLGYGVKNFKLLSRAIVHGLNGTFGQVVPPGKKILVE